MSHAICREYSATFRARVRSRSRNAYKHEDNCLNLDIPEDLECGICFESVGALGGAVSLPCACRTSFCHTCWDRALAASISACGLARCPSCRCPMRVDFDISLKRLVFSRASLAHRYAGTRYVGGGQAYEDPNADDWQQRLYEQAKPTQIHLLRQYGGRLPESLGGIAVQPWGPWPRLSDLDTPPVASEARYEQQESASASQSPSRSSTDHSEAEDIVLPRCICGCSLHHVSVQDRVRAFVTEEAPVPPPHHFVDRLLANPPIFCDICDRRLSPNNGVWTCENGGRTVLHAAAYDVCEACFAFHVHGDTSLAVSSYRDPARVRRKGGRIGSLRWS